MTQAIQTKYLRATDRKGSRIKATCAAGSLTIGYPHALDESRAHASAADKLVRKLGWTPDEGRGFVGGWAQGSLADESYVFVFVGPDGFVIED